MAAHEDDVLRALYVGKNIPTDQYPHRPDDLRELASNWNAICGRGESESDLLHFMITKRKKGKWPKLGRSEAEKIKSIGIGLSQEELEQLDAIHEEFQIASDNFVLDKSLANRLQKEFAKRTGRIFPALPLAAAMIRRRKSGSLATLRPESKADESKFADFDEVAG